MRPASTYRANRRNEGTWVPVTPGARRRKSVRWIGRTQQKPVIKLVVSPTLAWMMLRAGIGVVGVI